MRKKVLAARKMKRDELLFGEKKEREKGRIIFNINYHPALASLGKVMQKIQGLLACNLGTPEGLFSGPCSRFS